jgi:hypothetical protein
MVSTIRRRDAQKIQRTAPVVRRRPGGSLTCEAASILTHYESI